MVVFSIGSCSLSSEHHVSTMALNSKNSHNLFINRTETDETRDDSASVNSSDIYECYLQPDNYEADFEELNEFEADGFFESSQLHQLVHTQPIHLISQQGIVDYTPQTQKLVVEEEPEKKSFISPMMTSRSSSMSSTFSKCNSIYGNYYDSIQEEMVPETEEYGAFFGGKDQDKPLYSAFHSICNPMDLTDATVPRNYTCPKSSIEFCSNIETALVSADRYYHYSIQTSNTLPQTGPNIHQPTGEEMQFVKAINLKLSRYAGYFTAGSRDQEYSDKVRFQEISYKFSKTYFQ